MVPTANGILELMVMFIPLQKKVDVLSQYEYDNYLRSEEYHHDTVLECIN